MRIRHVLPVVAIVGVAPALYFLFPRQSKGDGIGDFGSWKPSQSEIARKVGSGAGGKWNDARHTAFTRMFQHRFRDNGHAVGVKFLDDNTLKAMFAPTIPKWDMARVSVQVEAEAYAVFGRPFNVDVYETYITAPMRKMAEVRRVNPDGPVQVRFDPRFAIEQLHERRAREALNRKARRIQVPPSAAPLSPLGGRRLSL